MNLTDLPNPARADEHNAFFETIHKAVSHLCKHVLTPTESEAWALVAEELAEYVDLGDENACFRARAAFEADPAEAQALYDAWAGVTDLARRSAHVLGWTCAALGCRAWLSPRGILVVQSPRSGSGQGGWGAVIRTVFIPGTGWPRAVSAEWGSPSKSPGRSHRGRGLRPMKSGREMARAEARSLNQTLEWRIYAEVFRPAVQAVRAEHKSAVMGANRSVQRVEWAELKHVVPSTSKLKYEDWLALRDVAERQSGGTAQ